MEMKHSYPFLSLKQDFMNALFTKITRSKSGIIKTMLQLWCFVFGLSSSLAQNVGIGIAAPTEKLGVLGNIKGINLYSSGFVGIGTTNPAYKLHIIDGTIGLFNSTSQVTWTINNYSSAGL